MIWKQDKNADKEPIECHSLWSGDKLVAMVSRNHSGTVDEGMWSGSAYTSDGSLVTETYADIETAKYETEKTARGGDA